jgi:hypothetical protein
MTGLTLGASFGMISGIMTALGLILSSYGAKQQVYLIILTLVSLAVSDGLSDALGIYYGSYVDDHDLTKSLKEAGRTFMGKASIPLVFALIFYFVHDMKLGSQINVGLAFFGILALNFAVFESTDMRILNTGIFITIVVVNYVLGSVFSKYKIGH